MSTTRPRLAKTKARGYGGVHKRERQRWARAVERGEVDCAHCRQLIEPDEPWDLGHVDDDRTRYAGPEHTRCNRQPRARRDRERDARTDPDPRPWTPRPRNYLGIRNSGD